MSELETLQVERLTDTVYGRLRDRILNGTYRPGQKLPVDQLAQQLGVSQTPVKGALSLLVAEGLVRTLPRRGTFVTEVNERELSESLSIRAALESLAADTLLNHVTATDLTALTELVQEIAAATDVDEHFRRNLAFHESLVTLSGNRKLAEIYRQLNAHIQIALVHSGSKAWIGRVQTEEIEHRAILDAIARRDAAALKSAVERHLREGRDSLLGQFRTQAERPEPA